MNTETDIVERLARSLKPFWSYTQNEVIGDAMAEITKLRAERDAAARDLATANMQLIAVEPLYSRRQLEDKLAAAAARDMRERCVQHVQDAGGKSIDWLAAQIGALPLIATEGDNG